jgi:hypothetical protein
MSEARRQDRGFSRRPKILDYVGVGGAEEEEARAAAETLVRRARSQSMRRVEESWAPSPESVRERREALHGPGEDR